MLLLRGGKMSIRLMAQYSELETTENRLGKTEVCKVRLTCLVKNIGTSYKSIARR